MRVYNITFWSNLDISVTSLHGRTKRSTVQHEQQYVNTRFLHADFDNSNVDENGYSDTDINFNANDSDLTNSE